MEKRRFRLRWDSSPSLLIAELTGLTELHRRPTSSSPQEDLLISPSRSALRLKMISNYLVEFEIFPLPTLLEDHYSRIRYDTLPTGVFVDNFKLLYRK